MTSPAALPFFAIANYVEAGFWLLVAIVCATRAIRAGGMRTWILAVAFLFFGLSDVIEVQTGAWYRPWWLLVWKAACLLTILPILLLHLRHRRNKRTGQP